MSIVRLAAGMPWRRPYLHVFHLHKAPTAHNRTNWVWIGSRRNLMCRPCQVSTTPHAVPSPFATSVIAKPSVILPQRAHSRSRQVQPEQFLDEWDGPDGACHPERMRMAYSPLPTFQTSSTVPGTVHRALVQPPAARYRAV